MAIGTPIDRGTDERNYETSDLVSNTFTPAADSLLIAIMQFNAGSFTSDGITGHDGGTAWAQYGSTQSYSSDSFSVWFAHTGSSPSSGAITLSAPSSNRGVACFIEVTGVDVSGTLANSVVQSDSGASYGSTITGTLSSSTDMVLHLVGSREYSGTGSFEVALTELNRIQNADTNLETIAGYAASGEDSPTYNCDSAQGYGYISVELKEAAGGAFTITTDTAAYTYTGTANSLLLSALMGADTDSYSYSGTNADLNRGFPLVAETDSYIYTGTEAALTFASTNDYTIITETDSYIYSGTATDLFFGASVTAETDLYSYTGTAAALSRNAPMTGDNGAYAYTGANTALNHSALIELDTSTYTYSGSATNFNIGGRVVVGVTMHIEIENTSMFIQEEKTSMLLQSENTTMIV